MKGQVLDEVLLHMDIFSAEADSTIFEIGSQGDLFYFIIEGIVEIRIPDF